MVDISYKVFEIEVYKLVYVGNNVMEINFISWFMFFIKVVNVYLVDKVYKLVNIGFEVIEILLINWLMLIIKLMIIKIIILLMLVIR